MSLMEMEINEEDFAGPDVAGLIIRLRIQGSQHPVSLNSSGMQYSYVRNPASVPYQGCAAPVGSSDGTGNGRI